MFSAFNKGLLVPVWLAACVSVTAFAETTVNVVGSGKDSAEAIAASLRVAVTKHLKKQDSALSQSVLKNEILPNASSFVQSYKILDGGANTYVNLSASIDLEVLRSLFALTPKTLQEEGAKALVVVKGMPLPELAAMKGAKAPEGDPYAVIDGMAKEYFQRRAFQPVRLSVEEAAAVGAGEDVASPELLRGLGMKTGARVAFGATARLELRENENSHREEERMVVTASLVDVKTGALLARETVNFPKPVARRDQFEAEFKKVLSDETRELFLGVFVQAGRHLTGKQNASGFSVVRVLHPSNPGLVNKFRLALESAKDFKSVAEYRIHRGAFDFAVTPALDAKAIGKIVQNIALDDVTVTVVPEEGGGPATLAVKLAPKATTESESDGGTDAAP